MLERRQRLPPVGRTEQGQSRCGEALNWANFAMTRYRMPLLQRAFRGPPDWVHMAAVIQAQPSDHLHVVDLPYRLCSWAFDEPANCAL
jgi:hypothetical protein